MKMKNIKSQLYFASDERSIDYPEFRMYKVFKDGLTLYIPHYTKKGIYVAAGGVERTEADLDTADYLVLHKDLMARDY